MVQKAELRSASIMPGVPSVMMHSVLKMLKSYAISFNLTEKVTFYF